MRLSKKIYILLIIVVFICVCIAALIWLTHNAGFQVDFTMSNIRDIKISDISLPQRQTVTDKDITYYKRNYKMKESDIRDMFLNPSEYVCIQYYITYYGNTDTPNNEAKLLGVFYRVEYNNELSKMYVGNTLRRDMELTYIKGKYYDNIVSVYLKRNGKSNDEILELAKEVTLKIVGLESYSTDEMINF